MSAIVGNPPYVLSKYRDVMAAVRINKCRQILKFAHNSEASVPIDKMKDQNRSIYIDKPSVMEELYMPFIRDAGLVIEYEWDVNKRIILSKMGRKVADVVNRIDFSPLAYNSSRLYDDGIILYINRNSSKADYSDIYSDFMLNFSRIRQEFPATDFDTLRNAVIHSLSSLVDRKILRKTGRGVYTKVKESDGEKLLPIQREVMSNLEKPMSVSQLNRRVKANYKTLLWNIWKLRDEGYVESTGTSTEYEFTRKGKKMADGMEEILKIVTEYASSKIL